MSQLSRSLEMTSQPSADSPELADAVISWHQDGADLTVLSRFSDDMWIGPPVGSLAAVSLTGRQIDLARYSSQWRDIVRNALYAAMRHPTRIATTPNFATLMKRGQSFLSFTNYCELEGITPQSLTPDDVRRFLHHRIQSVDHIETVVSLIGALRGYALHFSQGLTRFDLQYPFPLSKGAKQIAISLWREVRGSDFAGGGDPPYDDGDLTLIVSNAYLYVEALSSDIADTFERCLQIAELYPLRRSSRSQEGLCLRAQKRCLSEYPWKHVNSQIPDWPPTNFRQLLVHARLCSAASAIALSFATGARRGEIHSIVDDCLDRDSEGLSWLSLTHFKGRDELHGVQVRIPVDDIVVAAVASQRRIKNLIRKHLKLDGEDDEGVDYTGHLFVQIRYQTEPNESDKTQLMRTLEDGRLTSMGLSALVRTFKDRVVPTVDGPISFTRFRKSVARLCTLSMEGAPLILQVILGHTRYQTSVGYMFASPMINEEIVASYPELMANNLRTLYQEGDRLFGGGASAIKNLRRNGVNASMLTEPEIGMSEDEFVQLGLEMMQNGQMILSLLGPGMYCLKPLLARGPCNNDPSILLPNVGRCTPTCSHHLLLGSQRPKMVRQVVWLKNRLGDSNTSAPLRAYYAAHLREFSYVLEST